MTSEQLTVKSVEAGPTPGRPKPGSVPKGLEAAAHSLLEQPGTGDRGDASGEPRPARPRAAHAVENVGAYRTRIKICGLTREQDVDAAVAAGADAVGFVMYARSPRCISLPRAAELARRLPPFVTPVLLFVNEDAIKIIAACAQMPGATVQFHGDETPAQCLAATEGGVRPFLRAARIPLDDAPFNLVKFASEYSAAQAILLDAHVEGYGGGGKAFNWSRLPPNVDCHLVLSGGLTAANAADGILRVRPRCKTLAVDVSSGVELDGPANAGIKDAEKINRFVAAVRAADRQLAENSHAFLPAA